jgi:molybdopterin-guanine dinucleotide biosynthesis protein A
MQASGFVLAGGGSTRTGRDKDELPGRGPASGIYTALRVTSTHWNLVVACDMTPLCAVYHRRCLRALARAIRDKQLKRRDFVKEIGAICRPVQASALANVNTPAEWAEFEAKRS